MAQVAKLKGIFNFGNEVTAGTAVTSDQVIPLTRAALNEEPTWGWWQGAGSFDTEHGVKIGNEVTYSAEMWFFPQYAGYLFSNGYGGMTETSGDHTWAGAEWDAVNDAIQPWTIGWTSGYSETTSIGRRNAYGAVGNTLTISFPFREVTTIAVEGMARSAAHNTINMTSPVFPGEGAHERAFVFDDWNWTFGFNTGTPDTTLCPKEATLTFNNGFQFYYDMCTSTNSSVNLVPGAREVTISMVIGADTSSDGFYDVALSGSDGYFSFTAVASTTASSVCTITGSKFQMTSNLWPEIDGSSERTEFTVEARAVGTMPTIQMEDDVAVATFGRGNAS